MIEIIIAIIAGYAIGLAHAFCMAKICNWADKAWAKRRKSGS